MINNLDEIQDTDWLCCTDEDGVSKKVSGADFKALITPSKYPAPWMRAKVIKKGNDQYFNLRGTRVYSLDGTEIVQDPTENTGKWEKLTDGLEVYFVFDPTSRAYFNTGSWDIEIIEGDLRGRDKGMERFFENHLGFTGKGLIENINVSQIQNFNECFSSCTSLNMDFTDWNVKEAVNMDRMFAGCSSMVQDLSKWCVPKVTSHSNFSKNAPGIIKPKWGTCPQEPLYPPG